MPSETGVELQVDINGRGQQGAFTTGVMRMLEAAKRKEAEVKEPVRKAGEVSLVLLKSTRGMCSPINVYWLRTIMRLVVEYGTYFTYC